MNRLMPEIDATAENICQSCGACCAYSSSWPRFGMEDDETLALIPPEFVNREQTGMRCVGNRCSALAGTVGAWTACKAYATRPDVCRECLPGDDACNLARARYGLPALTQGA
jgi:Fe-S-cluster containining protein